MRTDILRKKFLDFFEDKNHSIVSSDTLVPSDETVFFTTAGMQQFKPYFLGEKKDIKRAASCQKCLRTDDLEKVGRTPMHHTFFEMLGNFSFGDYFKKEAVEFAWEFLTEDLSLKEADLWISVYKDDDEAFEIWSEHIGIPKDKIVKLEEDKNFWPANAPTLGPNGPCGPCSEIFFDRGKLKGCRKVKCSPACDCGRFVEVWNLVFTQFNRVGKNKLERLAQKNIDTGMGLERMAAVLQGKFTNFEIDILEPIVSYLEERIFKIKMVKAEENLRLIYAIVDHARAATFAICDGVFPSNEERGYVVRKLIRTALWKGTLLGMNKPYLYKLPSLYAKVMKTYPEIYEKRDSVSKIIFSEEEKFLLTLGAGKKQLKTIIEQYKRKKINTIGAKELFRLYDTHGFPLELSEEIIRKDNFKIDRKGFEELLRKQQELSRKKSMFDENIFITKDFIPKEKTKFIGYDQNEANAKILRLIDGNKEKNKLLKGKTGCLILDRTPFYPAGGGQLYDQGWIKTERGEFFVEEVFQISDTIVHKGKVTKGEIDKSNASVFVDKERREALRRAHTATHLLQAALREVLGKHIAQQGSLVDIDRLRFDFTHLNRLSDEDLEKVENLVKDFIKRKDKIEKKEVSLGEARKEGALAFFKDKYKEKVRLVSVADYSKELCGGTHLENTAEVKNFVIISESSISSGIRRIEALVGERAQGTQSLIQKRRKIAESKAKTFDEIKSDQELIKQAISRQEKEFVLADTGKVVGLEKIEGVNFLLHFFSSDLPSSSTQVQVTLKILDKIKAKLSSVFIFTVIAIGRKNIFVCSASEDLINKGLSCKNFVSNFGEKLSLKGGGRDNLVQGVALKVNGDFLEKVKESFCNFVKQ